jgi:hypothetical protein
MHHQTKEPFWLQLPPFDSSDKIRKAKTSATFGIEAEVLSLSPQARKNGIFAHALHFAA